jgi:hypothetical protein
MEEYSTSKEHRNKEEALKEMEWVCEVGTGLSPYTIKWRKEIYL